MTVPVLVRSNVACRPRERSLRTAIFPRFYFLTVNTYRFTTKSGLFNSRRPRVHVISISRIRTQQRITATNRSRRSNSTVNSTMEQPEPPPEALLPGYDMPDRGPIVIGLNIALMVVSTALVVSRFYVRQFMTKNLGPDDWVSLLALVGNTRQQVGPASNTDLGADHPNSTIGNGYAYGVQWCRTTHLRCSRGSTREILQDAADGAAAIFHRLFDHSNGDSTVPAPAYSLLWVSMSEFK